MTVTVAEMLKMSQAQFDDLFTQSPAGENPTGKAKGTAIVALGDNIHAEHRRFCKSFRVAGEDFRFGNRGFAK